MRRVRAWAAALLLALPLSAAAAPLTEADVADMKRLLGWDEMLGLMVESALATEAAELRECARPVLTSVYGGIIDRSLRASIPDHESAEAWRAFAATAGGARFLEATRKGTRIAVTEDRSPPAEELFGEMGEAEIAEVRAFLGSDVGSRGAPHLQSFAPADSESLEAGLEAHCGSLLSG